MIMTMVMLDTNAKMNAVLDWMGMECCRWDVRGGEKTWWSETSTTLECVSKNTKGVR